MRGYLIAGGALATLLPLVWLLIPRSGGLNLLAVHEIELALCALIATVSFGAAGIMGAIEAQTAALRVVIAAAASGRLKLGGRNE